jgi:hypothetical protein
MGNCAMPEFSHDDIVHAFLQSKTIDFEALGKFVAQSGPRIVAGGRGDYGVRLGRYNILACFNPLPIDFRREHLGLAAADLAAEVRGG